MIDEAGDASGDKDQAEDCDRNWPLVHGLTFICMAKSGSMQSSRVTLYRGLTRMIVDQNQNLTTDFTDETRYLAVGIWYLVQRKSA